MRKEGKRKALAALMCGSMLTVALVGGTLAYLTDAEGDMLNMFSAGNDVDIVLSETVGKNGVVEDENKVVLDDEGVSTELKGHAYENVMPGDKLIKEVVVANKDDSSNAYVAVTVKLNNAEFINLAIDEVYENDPYNYTDDQVQAIYDEVFNGWGINYNPRPGAAGVDDARGVIDGTYGLPEYVLHVDFAKTTSGSTVIGANNWFIAGREKAGQYWVDGPADYDGYYTKDMGDYEICYTYYAYLPAGASTTLFEGLNVPADWNSEQLAMFKNLEINVSAKAIQAANFASQQEAFEALHGDGVSATAHTPAVATADELVEALERGADVLLTDDVKIDPAGMSNAYGTTGINVKNGQTIDGGGHTLDIKGAGGTWDSGINTTGGLIKNITVTGSFRGIFINHNSTHSERVVLENVTIDGTTYTISCDQGTNQGLTATGSTFNGWTSFAATLGDAEFINCSFGEGNGYAYCRPYAPTTFVGCAFEAGYEMDARAAVTFENCTIGGAPLTSENLATLVTSNIANASVK